MYVFISSEYVIVNLNGIPRPVRSANENYKMKKTCPQWDSNPGPSAYMYEAKPLGVALLY